MSLLPTLVSRHQTNTKSLSLGAATQSLNTTVLQVPSSYLNDITCLHICMHVSLRRTLQTPADDIASVRGAFLLMLFLQTPLESLLALSPAINHCYNRVNCHGRGRWSLRRGDMHVSVVFVNTVRSRSECFRLKRLPAVSVVRFPTVLPQYPRKLS